MPSVTANGINIYYEIHGDGEPLVLIPGLATDVSEYAGMIQAFSQRYRVIAFDNRGAGRTDKPDLPYSIEMMAEDAVGLLSALEIPPAHVIGISMGGRIAVALALGYPDKVRSLILVSTFVRRIKTTWRSRLLLNVLLLIPALLSMGKKNRQPYFALVHQRNASRGYDASDRLHEIYVPTLILRGTKDHLAPYKLAEEMHAGISGSKLVTFDGGHIFPFQKQQQFVDAVFEFLTPKADAQKE